MKSACEQQLVSTLYTSTFNLQAAQHAMGLTSLAPLSRGGDLASDTRTPAVVHVQESDGIVGSVKLTRDHVSAVRCLCAGVGWRGAPPCITDCSSIYIIVLIVARRSPLSPCRLVGRGLRSPQSNQENRYVNNVSGYE